MILKRIFEIVGTVQLWDLRRPEKCTIQYTAHSGPIYTCDWHPTQPWLATGSRDKLVKIWNTEHKPVLEHTLTTIAVVGKVKWRPDRMYNIASASLVADYSIYVWDLRRPYLPYISFDDHINTITGIAWKGDDPGVLLSSSKDSRVLRHTFRDASPPSGKPSSQGISLNLTGDIQFSYKAKNIITTSVPQSTRTSFISTGKQQRIKQQTVNDQFHLAKSCLINYTSKQQSTLYKDFNSFHGCAREYILSGKSLTEMCEHNSQIARHYGKSNVCLLWKFVKNQYANQYVKQSSLLKCGDQRGIVGGVSGVSGIIGNIVGRTTPTNQTNRFLKMLPIAVDDTNKINSERHQLPAIDDDSLLMNCLEDVKRTEFNSTITENGGSHVIDGKSDVSNVSGSDSIPIVMVNGQTGIGSANKTIGGITTPLSPIVDPNSITNFIYGDSELTINMDGIKSLRNGFLYFGPHDLTTREWALPSQQNSSSEIGHDLQTAIASNENCRQQDVSPVTLI